jgi:hypothetical protein
VSDGATTAGEATEDGVETVIHAVSDGATTAGEATEDGVETVIHAVSGGATTAGDAAEDGFHDASVATVNAVDGVMAAVDGAVDQLTHGHESDDWVDAELFDDAENADAPSDASSPAAHTSGPAASQSTPTTAIPTTATPSSSSPSSSPSSSSASVDEQDERVIPFDSDAFDPSFAEPVEEEAVVEQTPEAAYEARARAAAAYDDEGVFVADPGSNSNQPSSSAPPPAPVYLPEVMPTILETCDTCKTPPCRLFEADVKETEFIVHAESCCQATRWQYGNTGAFPHMCGACAPDAEQMTYARALNHCFEVGGGLCANNQVTAGSRTPTCAVDETNEVWTSESCGPNDEGRFVMLAGGGGRRCEFDLEKSLDVVCCANTCNTFIPDHMCPSEDKREFWQASAEASAGAAASAAMGAARARDAKTRVALPELPQVKASRAKQQLPARTTEGAPFRAAALGSPEEKEAVLRAARDAMAATAAAAATTTR